MIWGIDPGVSGAVVFFDALEGVLEIHDMPILEVKKKKQVSPQLLSNILKQHHAPLYIEQVGAMPGQGVTSMFNFGKSYGICLGAAAALQLPTTTVAPQTWMKKIGKPQGKDGSRERAIQVFPSFSQSFARKKDDGRADAALIAYFGFIFGESVE